MVRVPPLRERREDIPLFARRFVDRFAREMSITAPGLSPAALQVLLGHDWPGNARELENVLGRAIVLCDGRQIDPTSIELGGGHEPARPGPGGEPTTLQEAKARAIAEVERTFALRCLTEAEGNIALAARKAGKDRKSFWELLRKHGIDPEPFRQRKRKE